MLFLKDFVVAMDEQKQVSTRQPVIIHTKISTMKYTSATVF